MINTQEAEDAIRRYLPVDSAGLPLPVPPVFCTDGLELSETTVTGYGPDNRAQEMTSAIGHEKPLVRRERYAYTPEGLLAEARGVSTGYGQEPYRIESLRTYGYDPDGELLREETRHAQNGKASSHVLRLFEEYRFDPAGGLASRLVRDGGELRLLQIFAYDAEGRLAERNVTYGYLHDNSADAAFHREHGNAARAVPHPSQRGEDQRGRSITREVFEYGRNGRIGRVLEYYGGGLGRETRYLYDGRGNWVRRVHLFAPDTILVEDRDIVYAE